MLRFLPDALWFVPGGFVMGLGWWLAGLVAAVTLVGLPRARACFVSIIGIPFGIRHIRLVPIGLAPIGLQVVPLRR